MVNMRRRKLGRKGIRFRNRLVVVMLITLVICFIIFINYDFEEKIKLKYEMQTQELVQAQEMLAKEMDGETYYIAANGTSKEGTDPNNPMSLKTALNKKYIGNDKILFKAGDTFYGVLNFNIVTTDDTYVLIGSYGEGEKPIISGANILADSKAWEKEGDLYKIDLTNYEKFSEGIGKIFSEPYNIGFIQDEKGNIYGSRKRSKEEIEKEYDYYCEDQFFYLKCSQNPTEKLGKITFVARYDLVRLASNTILENLDIQCTGAHGISKKGSEIKNAYIKDCILQNIGGSVQIASTFTRYGNGIEFWNQAQNTIVEGCIFRNIYDAGYTTQGNAVTTGFENNICQNNIFINCTYPYETSCRNQKDQNKKICMKGQKYIHNLSINQGRGWGEEVRSDKDAVAEFVLWSMPFEDTDIEISNNTFYYSKRLQYSSVYTNIPVEIYRKNIAMNHNKIYLTEDTYLMNNQGNYQDKEILKEYNSNQDSTFRLLENKELEKISDTPVLKTNHYNEIKEHYEKVEKELTITDIEMNLMNQYENLQNTYTQLLQDHTELAKRIIKIKQDIEQIKNSQTPISEAQIKELMQANYEIGNKIIEQDQEEVDGILKSIDEIGNTYGNLLAFHITQNPDDFNKIHEKIEELEGSMQQNQDLNLQIANQILSTSKEHYATYLENTEQNVGKAIQIDYLLKWTQKIVDKKINQYIANNPVAITYSETKLTNQDIIATVETNATIEITNNANSKQYTFIENGKFVFEYRVKGRKNTIEAKVGNIDKIAPKIEGIETQKVYTQKVSPKISDANLEKVELYLNGQKVEDYKTNTEIKEEGFYQIIATDQAGNRTTIQFQILENKVDSYQIEKETIKNITNNTSKTSFVEKLNLKLEYEIYRDDEKLENEEVIATGDVLKTTTGDTYTLIVAGDINKDGNVNIKDIVKMRKYLLEKNNLDEVEILAADTNLDANPITIKDLIRMRMIALDK